MLQCKICSIQIDRRNLVDEWSQLSPAYNTNPWLCDITMDIPLSRSAWLQARGGLLNRPFRVCIHVKQGNLRLLMKELH